MIKKVDTQNTNADFTNQYDEQKVLALLQDENTQRNGFEWIVRQYGKPLYWQIRRMVFSHEDANDLLQNTFMKAWLNINYFRAEAKLSTWLHRIAFNECLTFLGKQSAVNSVSIDDPEAAMIQKLEGDAYFSGDRIHLLLQKALLTLPKKQRMVFNLKYYQDMKYEEMSEIFGTSVGALKASYHHAVKKIEKFITEAD
ncbi:ECF RNA polymerase sigma factor SigW [termite gut metagenome]|uniref:ECF RNA polymerase sigma factor SigW n=1 Tax=termite gut metagenome TaxID=433724 RepID=A0A5J4QVF3_9ZZZZ